ncbi:O-antigen ligase family protein [Desulfoplanes formicivorans]|nr:O-antigen ligase family protein [Desulfoplanes formicivorans]
MAYANFLSISFLLISLTVNLSFVYNPSFMGSLSLKNLSLYIIIILYTIQVTFQGDDKSETMKKVSKYIIIYIVYSFVIMIYKSLINNDVSNLLNLLMNFKSSFDAFLIYVLIENLHLKERDANYSFYVLILCFFLLNAMTVFDSLGLVSIEGISFDTKYGRSQGSFGESNVYASYVSFFIPIVIAGFFMSKNLLWSIFLGINLLFGAYSIVLTGSRTAFLSSLFALIAFFVLSRNKIMQNKNKNLLLFIIFLVISSIGIYKTIPETTVSGLETNIVSRYQHSSLDEYSSGRLGLWKKGLEIYVQNPLLGISEDFTSLVGSNTHNTYLEVLISKGLIGLIFFMLILVFLVKKTLYLLSSKKNELLYYGYLSGLLSFMISMLALNMFSAYYFFFVTSSIVLKENLKITDD